MLGAEGMCVAGCIPAPFGDMQADVYSTVGMYTLGVCMHTDVPRATKQRGNDWTTARATVVFVVAAGSQCMNDCLSDPGRDLARA